MPLKFAVRRIESGGTPLSSAAEYWADDNAGIPWVTIGDMSQADTVLETSRRITESGRASKSLAIYPAGTLLYSMYASIGKVSRLGLPAAINQAILAIDADERLCKSAYLRWLLVYVTERILESTNNNTQDNLNLQKVRDARLLLPPLERQTDICNFLDRESAKADALVAKYEQLIELLEEKRTALIAQAVTKGLDPSVPMKDSEELFFGQVPAHWQVVQLRRLIAKFVDYRGGTPRKTDGGVTLVTAANVKEGYIDYSCSQEFMADEDYDSWMVRGLPEKGDVLLTMEAPLGQAAQVDETHIGLGQRVMLLKPDLERVLPEFLMWEILSAPLRAELFSRSTGSTAIGLKASKLREIPVAVPPLGEQAGIVRVLKTESNAVDRLNDALRRAQILVREHRAALITAAVTGQIDVTTYKMSQAASEKASA